MEERYINMHCFIHEKLHFHIIMFIYHYLKGISNPIVSSEKLNLNGQMHQQKLNC